MEFRFILTVVILLKCHVVCPFIFRVNENIINCTDYSALDDYDKIYIKFFNGPNFEGSFKFNKCFNNDTNHNNYNKFVLQSVLNRTVHHATNSEMLSIIFDAYGIVDGNVFYRDTIFANFVMVKLQNIGSVNTGYLQGLQNREVRLINVGQVNFDDFATNAISSLYLSRINISSFTKPNLSKFYNISLLEINNFAFSDSYSLNTPNIFERNANLEFIYITGSSNEIIFHEAVFNGAHGLKFLDLPYNKIKVIPKILFNGLPNLQQVNLMGNPIKTMHPYTFNKNSFLKRITIGNNELFNSESALILTFSCKVSINIWKVNFKYSNTLSNLFMNSNITELQITDSKFINFDLTDFNSIQNRSSTIEIVFYQSTFRFPLAQLRAKHINYTIAENINCNATNARILFDLESMLETCPQCVFDTGLFLLQLYVHFKNIGICLRDAAVLMSFKQIFVPLENKFERKYENKCPKMCKCVHRVLLDEIAIDCSSRELTKIPLIPFPTDIKKIDSIKLNMTGNSLRTINFENQDDRVLKYLTSIQLHDNPIESIDIGEYTTRFNKILYCTRQSLQRANNKTTYGDNGYNATLEICSINTNYSKDPKQYIRQKSAEEITKILDTIPCDETCGI